MHFTSIPLPFDEYSKYDIDHQYSAFIYEYLNISAIDADNIESEVESSGLKIFHSNLSRANLGKFTLELIVARSGFTF